MNVFVYTKCSQGNRGKTKKEGEIMEQEKQYEAPGYMTYREAAIMFSLMPESDAAKAIKATVNYYLYGQIPSNLDGVAEKVFQIMRADIDRNNDKYRKICERNSENINKRWRRA